MRGAQYLLTMLSLMLAASAVFQAVYPQATRKDFKLPFRDLGIRERRAKISKEAKTKQRDVIVRIAKCNSESARLVGP